MENSTSFGKQAAAYAKGRPGYPYALYRWIADNSPAHNLIWDIAVSYTHLTLPTIYSV